MKMKKILAAVLAGVTVLGSALTVSAATVDGSAGWWKAWSEGYEVADGKTVEFDIDVKGGPDLWSNVAAVFANVKTDGKDDPNNTKDSTGYKEYAVIRGDNWGWGGGDNKTLAGNDISYDGGVASVADDATFIAMMKDAHLDVKISRSGNNITYVYDATGKDGTKTTRTAKFTDDLSAGCYVFFVPDTSTFTVTQVTSSDAAAPASTESQAAATGTSQAASSETQAETGSVTAAAATAGNAAFGSTVANVAVKAVTIDGKEVTPVVVNGQEAVIEKANDKQKQAIADVFGVSDPAKALKALFEKVVKKTAEKVEVVAVADISLPDGVTIPADGIKLDIDVDASLGIKKGATDYYILHLTSDGVWEYIPAEATADNVLTGTFKSLSPVYIVKAEKVADITSTDEKKPDTGDASLLWIVAVLAAGGALVAFSRKRIVR